MKVTLFQPTVTKRGPDGQKIKIKCKVWCGKWTDPVSGKRKSRSTGAYGKDAARTIVRQWERDELFAYHGVPQRREQVTWEVAEKQFTELKGRLRGSTVADYRRAFRKFREIVDIDLHLIDSEALEDFTAAFVSVKPTTVNKYLRCLRAFVRWCYRRKYLRMLPSIDLLREDEVVPVDVPDEDIQAVLKVLAKEDAPVRFYPREWWMLFFQLAIWGGLRRGELLQLQWENVDEVRKTILVHRETTKGRKDRLFEGADLMIAEMVAYRDRLPVNPEPTDRVFAIKQKTPRCLYYDWDAILVAAGVPEVRRFKPHNLRSTCCSQLADGNGSLVVRDWLGHSTVQVTERYYSQTRAARRRIAEAREPVRPL